MSRSRQGQSHGSSERWLVSYADFITLMFAFFVVMYSSARMDQKKAAQLAGAIEAAFQELGTGGGGGAQAGGAAHTSASPAALKELSRTPDKAPRPSDAAFKKDDFAAIQAELEKALAAELKRQEIAVHMQSDGLVVSLREIGFFDSGSAVLKPSAEGAFQRVTRILQAHQCELRVEGHTDNVPIHNSAYPSNWELSTARATEVVKHLIENYKFPAERLSAAGYGEYHPVANNNEAQGRRYNRRVDVVIVAAEILSPRSNAGQRSADAHKDAIGQPQTKSKPNAGVADRDSSSGPGTGLN